MTVYAASDIILFACISDQGLFGVLINGAQLVILESGEIMNTDIDLFR